jgi:hypothetical protein
MDSSDVLSLFKEIANPLRSIELESIKDPQLYSALRRASNATRKMECYLNNDTLSLWRMEREEKNNVQSCLGLVTDEIIKAQIEVNSMLKVPTAKRLADTPPPFFVRRMRSSPITVPKKASK